MNEITKDIREGGVKEYLYTDDLVLFEDSWKVQMRYALGKRVMTGKDLK